MSLDGARDKGAGMAGEEGECTEFVVLVKLGPKWIEKSEKRLAHTAQQGDTDLGANGIKKCNTDLGMLQHGVWMASCIIQGRFPGMQTRGKVIFEEPQETFGATREVKMLDDV